MLGFLANTTLLSFRDPRRGVRMILDNVHGVQGAAVLLGLALVALCLIVTVEWLLFGAPDMSGLPEGAPKPTLAQAVQGTALVSAISFGFITAIVFGVGRMFGGTGDLPTIAVALAWHSLITAIFAPFVSLRHMTAEGGPDFWRIGLILFTLWLLICFIAEAHRFASAWRVGGVLAGFMFGLSVFTLFLLRGAA
jgi:hypothetical protein